jgi:hypothetical protein
MSRFAFAAIAAFVVVALQSAARADLVITVNKSSQSMSVVVDGQQHAERKLPAAVAVAPSFFHPL